MYEKGVITGGSSGGFRPDDAISRAEFTAIINRAWGLEDSDADFADVSEDDWFYQDVANVYGAGYVNGFGDGLFRPHEEIRRADMTTILMRYLSNELEIDLSEMDVPDLVDQDHIPNYARSYVGAAIELGVVRGYDDGTFRPFGQATRAEAVSVLNQVVVNTEPKQEEEDTDDIPEEAEETPEERPQEESAADTHEEPVPILFIDGLNYEVMEGQTEINGQMHEKVALGSIMYGEDFDESIRKDHYSLALGTFLYETHEDGYDGDWREYSVYGLEVALGSGDPDVRVYVEHSFVGINDYDRASSEVIKALRPGETLSIERDIDDERIVGATVRFFVDATAAPAGNREALIRGYTRKP